MEQCDPAKELNEFLVPHLAEVIFQADKSLALLRTIGENADEINQARFGSLFGSLQDRLKDHFILSLAKLTDPPRKPYRVRSMPALARFLRDHADELAFQDEDHVRAYLRGEKPDRPADGEDVAQWYTRRFQEQGATQPPESPHRTDTALTKALADSLDATLDAIRSGANDLAKAYKSVRWLRDKKIAHREATGDAMRPECTWGDADSLLGRLKELVAVVAMGYCSMSFTDANGVYHLTRDAGRVGILLERLLAKARIIRDDSNEDSPQS